MADNYIGRKMEEYFERKAQPERRPAPKLESLLLRNRSVRGYDSGFRVREDQLRRIVAVNSLLPSARNQQVLRFRLVLADEAPEVLKYVKMGAALPELHLPVAGSEPNAFIVVCSTVQENREVDIDLGISVQSMLLQATEIGLNGLCIGAFDRKGIREALHLPLDPLLVVAVGRKAERIELREIGPGEDHRYYRTETGTHVVPKLRLEDLLLPAVRDGGGG